VGWCATPTVGERAPRVGCTGREQRRSPIVSVPLKTLGGLDLLRRPPQRCGLLVMPFVRDRRRVRLCRRAAAGAGLTTKTARRSPAPAVDHLSDRVLALGHRRSATSLAIEIPRTNRFFALMRSSVPPRSYPRVGNRDPGSVTVTRPAAAAGRQIGRTARFVTGCWDVMIYPAREGHCGAETRMRNTRRRLRLRGRQRGALTRNVGSGRGGGRFSFLFFSLFCVWVYGFSSYRKTEPGRFGVYCEENDPWGV